MGMHAFSSTHRCTTPVENFSHEARSLKSPKIIYALSQQHSSLAGALGLTFHHSTLTTLSDVLGSGDVDMYSFRRNTWMETLDSEITPLEQFSSMNNLDTNKHYTTLSWQDRLVEHYADTSFDGEASKVNNVVRNIDSFLLSAVILTTFLAC